MCRAFPFVENRPVTAFCWLLNQRNRIVIAVGYFQGIYLGGAQCSVSLLQWGDTQSSLSRCQGRHTLARTQRQVETDGCLGVFTELPVLGPSAHSVRLLKSDARITR
jgi:hypothetical protein